MNENEIQMIKRVLNAVECPICDGSGAIPHQTVNWFCDDEGNPYQEFDVDWEQCQWCDEKDTILTKIKDFEMNMEEVTRAERKLTYNAEAEAMRYKFLYENLKERIAIKANNKENMFVDDMGK